MSRIAVFPGSFDPITIGHYSIVEKALPLFDAIIIAVGTNTSKSYLFDENKRFEMTKQAFDQMPKVKVIPFEGLTVDFCKAHKAQFLIRGLRNNIDFEYEKPIAEINKKLLPELETIFFITDAEFSCVSSSIVRELLKNNSNVDQFLPPSVRI